MMAAGTDRRPEWLIRKHGKQRSEPYLELLAKADRCTAGHDGRHDRIVIITTVFDLDGNELPIATEDEARNVSNALKRSRPRGDGGQFLISLLKPELVQNSDGTWEVRACVHDKAAGDAWITADPSRLSYDPQARVAEAATRGPTRRRRPSQRAIEREQMALRAPVKKALTDITIGGETAKQVSVPDVPPAPFGFCENCGKRLGQNLAEHGERLCVGCQTTLAVLKVKAAEYRAEERRDKAAAVVARFTQARKQQVTPATRLMDFWQSLG